MLGVLCVAVVLLAGCDSDVRLASVFGGTPSFHVTNTFGQLVQVSPGKVAHYVTIQLDGADAATPILAPTSGTIEFFATLDGLSNCIVLYPKLRDEDDATRFTDLGPDMADPENLCIALCNLDNTGPLQASIQSIYTDRGADDPSVEAAAFLATPLPGEKRKRLDVWAFPEASGQPGAPAWSSFGPAVGGKLEIAIFDIVDEVLLYKNPFPYLAAIPWAPGPTRIRAPAFAEIRLEAAPDETFTSGVTSYDVSIVGSLLPAEDLSGSLRVFFRLRQSADDSLVGPVVAPYEIAYELREASSGTARSHGVFRFNAIPTSDVLDLDTAAANIAEGLYRTDQDPAPTSNPATENLWVQLPLDPAEVSGGVETKNALALTSLNRSLDLDQVDGGGRRYPEGPYELEIHLRNAFGAAITDSEIVRFAVASPISIVSVEGTGATPARVYQEKGGAPPPFAPNRMYVGNSGTAIAPVAQAPTVVVTARVSPPGSVARVFWSWFDPDEPSGAVPDDTDANDGDNDGAAPSLSAHPGFDFRAADASSVPDASGIVKVRLTANTYGGDNFRVGVSDVAGSSNADRYAKRATQTKILTVWKRLVLENPDAIAGSYPVGAAVFDAVDDFLDQVYVEREMVGAGGAVAHGDAAISGNFTDNGRYGPDNPGISGKIEAIADHSQDANGDTIVLVFLGARSRALDLIDPTGANARAAPLDAANLGTYVFTAAGNANDDVDETEDTVDNVVAFSGPTEADPDTTLFVDTNAMYSRFSATFTADDRLVRGLIHELGHHLGLDAQAQVHSGVGNHIMASVGSLAGGAADIADLAARVANAHWHDDSGEDIREDFAPRRQ